MSPATARQRAKSHKKGHETLRGHARKHEGKRRKACEQESAPTSHARLRQPNGLVRKDKGKVVVCQCMCGQTRTWDMRRIFLTRATRDMDTPRQKQGLCALAGGFVGPPAFALHTERLCWAYRRLVPRLARKRGKKAATAPRSLI